MDMNQYLEVFIEESKEHLQTCNEQLLELEKDPNNIAIVNEIFRSAHTLKGMSATMGYEDLANLTHNMENVLDGIRNGKITVSSEVMDVIFAAVDDLEAMVNSIASGGDGKRDVELVVKQLALIEKGLSPFGTVEEDKVIVDKIELEEDSLYDEFDMAVFNQSTEQGFTAYQIKVSLQADCLLKAARVFMVFKILEKVGEVIKSTPTVEQLEEEQFDQTFTVAIVSKETQEDIRQMVLKVSEVETVEITVIDNQVVKQVSPIEQVDVMEPMEMEEIPVVKTIEKKQENNTNTKVNTNKTIRVNIERLDILMNLFEELVIDRGRLEQISRELNSNELHETVERMSRTTGDLQNIILNMRMVPVETVFNRFPKMVRTLARDLDKKVDLQIIGAETELDRTVIDEIGDPLVHLIRNALDHGIETPEVRKAKGKSEEGTMILKAYHSGNHVFIQIEDDGAGIKRDKVIKKALEKGIITEQQVPALTDKQVNELILASGFSTADKISDISGRGVGLDVVKSKIEALGGSISIDSKEDKGSIFAIQLPLTLSIISVMLTEIQKEKYAIPLSSIIETAIVRKEDILNAHNQRVIDFRGKVVPLVFLKEIFEVPSKIDIDDFYSVVIVRKGEKMAGLVVDSFIGQQEVVLKSLGNYLTDVFAISGATILGDGQVALIIDCNALIK